MAAHMRPRVIIIGAGFGGLFAARTLAGKPVDVLLIDRNNYHTFTPLLYQVATCALDPSEIAYPVRSIFRDSDNVRCLLGEGTAISYQDRHVLIEADSGNVQETYDYLIVAAGSTTTFFGNETFEQRAFQLQTLRDTVTLRNHILRLFERADWTEDLERREAMTTIAVVGGGPTGLETAGALYELYNHVLEHEYSHAVGMKARVVLVEMLPYVLSSYPDKLQQSALTQLRSLGVEVILGNPVEHVASDHVLLGDGTVIPTHTLVWAAGVKASPIADCLNVKLAGAGRLPVKATMEVVDRERIYAVGDIAYLEDPDGVPYPMLIPVAKQQGILAARNILRRISGRSEKTFRYRDLGTMATIGRSRAVAWILDLISLSGFVAWTAWLGLHLIALMGFRNQLNVLVNWIWNYLTYDRSVRIILEHASHGQDVTTQS
jgi:NADH dehydrogenase